MANVFTENNSHIRVELMKGNMTAFSPLPNFRRSKIDDCMEDSTKKIYVCSNNELYIYKIKVSGTTYLTQINAKNPTSLSKRKYPLEQFLVKGNWRMCHRRLFYNRTSKRVYWWSALNEVIVLDAHSLKQVESYKFPLTDKLKVAHGQFLVYMAYCARTDSMALLVNHMSLEKKFSVFVHRFGSERSAQDLYFNDFGSKKKFPKYEKKRKNSKFLKNIRFFLQIFYSENDFFIGFLLFYQFIFRFR